MNTSLLFESEEERIATERVLAAFKVKSINKEIDNLITDILKYAKEIDNHLEENGYSKRYLNRVGMLSENSSLELDSDLLSLDFRVREIVEDLIKRINTRVELIKDNDNNLNMISEAYDLKDINLEEEIKTAKLNEEYFV